MKNLILIGFIVTWTAASTNHTTCPSAMPKVNRYTGAVEFPQNIPAVACYKTEIVTSNRVFETLEEVDEFKGGCAACVSDGIPFPSPCCYDWKVDVQ